MHHTSYIIHRTSGVECSFMSPILVAAALIVLSDIILPSKLVEAISCGIEGTLG